MEIREKSKLVLKLGALVLGTTLGATGTYLAALGVTDGTKTFIDGRANPQNYPNYAQRQENNQWYLGIGGLTAISGAYLAKGSLKRLRSQ